MSDSKVEQKKRPNTDLDTEEAEKNKEKDNKITNNNENKKAKVGEKEGEKENKKAEEKEEEKENENENENENEHKGISDLWPDVVHMVGVVDDMDTNEDYRSEEENEGEKDGDEEDEEFGGIPGDEIEGIVFYGFNREEIEKLLEIQKQYGKDDEEIFGETARTNEESGWFSLRDLCVRFSIKRPKKMKPIAEMMFDQYPSDFTFFSFTLSKEKPPGDNFLKVSPSEYDPQLCTAYYNEEKWCYVSDFKRLDNNLQETYHKLVYKNLLL